MAIHHKSSTITIFFFTLLLRQFAASDIGTAGLIGSCITPYNQSVNNLTNQIDTTYESTLQTLFSNLASASASSSSLYSKSTAGQSPSETAYGLYLCRGDDSSDACRACVKSLTDTMSTSLQIDPCKEGFSYTDNCMIHFANYSFFGKSNDVDMQLWPSKFSETDYQEYNRTLQGALKGAINDAVFNSATSFATREAETASGAQEKVYALAQCSRDLDRQTCSGCLNAALVALSNNVAHSKPGISKSASALLASCQLRYDNMNFYGGVSSAMANSPTVVSAFLVATWSLFLVHFLLG